MYFTFIIPAILLIILLRLIFLHCRKKKLINKICHMSLHDKYCMLEGLIEPLGYCYDVRQDVFTSTTDAWQKLYGYGHIYDELAPYASMIFDCEPVYFNYAGRTWLIEFWKGQYGINTGCEIGVYRADRIIPPEQWKTTIFSAVPEEEYLDMRAELFRDGKMVANISGAHWWLTIFSMGCFSNPCDLCLNVSIRFPDEEMQDAFVKALSEHENCRPDSICVCGGTVMFCFCIAPRHICFFRKLYCMYVQFKNRFFCRLYCFVTRPFSCTCDKLLYLYFYLPFAFRHMLRLKRFKAIRKRH